MLDSLLPGLVLGLDGEQSGGLACLHTLFILLTQLRARTACREQGYEALCKYAACLVKMDKLRSDIR